ncbi:MAG: hypothetical protein RL662_711 [Bacteroidota bacterium]|jgi:hypothetical protein
MNKRNVLERLLNLESGKVIHPGFSIDCVIICFYNKKINVLLNNFKGMDKWMLPGGMLTDIEDVEEAAHRILHDRTGVRDAFLQQFHLFGAKNRTNVEENIKILKSYGISQDKVKSRYVSIGYYSLLKHDSVHIQEKEDDSCMWFTIDKLPTMYGDHQDIISKAISTLRQGIGYVPIGYNLLNEKFTISELRKIYEGISGESFDRRNFQKRMLATGIIERLDETKEESKSYHKPILYSFNKKKTSEYFEFYTYNKNHLKPQAEK